jgi:hypothetical protein
MSVDERLLVRRWLSSFEENRPGIEVYRPAEFAFPPARGRAGIEFQADGSVVELAIGRGDAPEARPDGTWQIDVDGSLVITSAAGERRVREIQELTRERLQLRSRDTA